MAPDTPRCTAYKSTATTLQMAPAIAPSINEDPMERQPSPTRKLIEGSVNGNRQYLLAKNIVPTAVEAKKTKRTAVACEDRHCERAEKPTNQPSKTQLSGKAHARLMVPTATSTAITKVSQNNQGIPNLMSCFVAA